MGVPGPPPTDELSADAPLVAVRRGPLVESYHRGRIVFCGPDGEFLDAVGAPDGYAYVRSSAKPFQALPLILSGAADACGLTDEDLAVACASHNAEERHLGAVRSILRKAGLSESDLQSGAHPPMYAPAAAALARRGEEPRGIHGNCSGKHAGMLAVCAHQGWETETYRKPDHPLQRWISDLVSKVCAVEQDALVVSGDGCGLPAFAMPLRSLATGFARLATGRCLPDDLAQAALRIRDAMRAHPFMVAGTGRLDTEVMEATDLVTKMGAEGVLGVGSLDGWGMALKVSDGAGRAVRPAALAALSRRGVEASVSASAPVNDLHGVQVGEITSLWTSQPAE
ncbi:MAG TPA: asparaginase [Rubrobacteraceae bacterium]|nr:asparaginase [Rubrobacteraceae bacterium]